MTKRKKRRLAARTDGRFLFEYIKAGGKLKNQKGLSALFLITTKAVKRGEAMINVRDLAHQDYLAGMKHKDIAEKHNVTLAVVKAWARRYWKKDTSEELENDTRDTKKDTQKDTKDTRISWVEIETEYVTDVSRKPCTLKGLADKYSIPFKTVSAYSASNCWKEKRKNYGKTMGKKAAEKTADLASEKIAQANSQHCELSNRIMNALEEALKDDRELFKYVEVLRTGEGAGIFADTLTTKTLPALNSKRLVEITKALKDNQDIQRKALGVLTPSEEHKIDYDNKKLELEKQKTEQGDGKATELILDWFSAVTESGFDADG